MTKKAFGEKSGLPRKNEAFSLLIEDMSEDGLGIGHLDGFCWFVKGAVPGDYCLVRAVKLKRNYGYAITLKVLSPSPARTEPSCPVSDPCGGCSLMRMSYEAELVWKERKVLAALSRIGGFGTEEIVLEPIIGMGDPYRYRNKAIYPIGKARDGRIISGFFAGRTHSIIECGDCLLEPVEFRDILRQITAWMEEEGIEPFDEADGSGAVRHVMLRKAFSSGDIMVVLVAAGKPDEKALGRLTAALTKKRHEIVSISLCLNRERGNAVLKGRIQDLCGTGYIEDTLSGTRFRISARSFYQVNPLGTEHLYETALSFAALTGREHVLDLYSGIGTISLLAARRAGYVCGIEMAEEAVIDAVTNAKLNKIENVSFVAGKVEDILCGARGESEPRGVCGAPRSESGYAPGDARHVVSGIPAPGAQGYSFDTVFLDPPRKGAEESALSAIADISPEKIVYISCNPATLARDMKFLSTRGYTPVRVRPVDMFPRTTHVECVVLMSRVGV